MKTFRLLSVLAALALLCALSGCGGTGHTAEDDTLNITCTTYPLYALTSALTAGADNVEVRRLNTGSVSCLHDYTLTVADMRHLEQADLLVMNGAGLEVFLAQAMEHVTGTTVDCSHAAHLLEGDTHEQHEEAHHGHDHDHEHDAHYWMDPHNLIHAAELLCTHLIAADPKGESLYRANTEAVCAALDEAMAGWAVELTDLSFPYLITFHDGFHYFAQTFGLELLFSMEEEDGATASARDILHAASLVKEYDLPGIFTEENGSGAAARAVSGETGAEVYTLSMLMSGPDAPAGQTAEEIIRALYIRPMNENITTLKEVLK